MKIAAIQMCSSHIVDDNLLVAATLIKEAADNGAQLVALPEMFAIMGLTGTDKVNVKEVFGNGKIQDFLSVQAKQNKIEIVGGTIPIACDDNTKVRAACLVFNEQGEMIARYDKIHLFDVTLSPTEIYRESDTTQPGNQLVVIDTSVGKLGLAVCYDVRFPELFRCLVNQGAEIIVLPSAFTVKTGAAHWELLARSRAVENFCYLIGPCQGGTHSSSRQTFGNSLIIEPWGTCIKKEGITPGVIYSDINLEHLREIRKSVPALNHQKIFCKAPSQ